MMPRVQENYRIENNGVINPTIVDVLKQKGAKYTCSYGEEEDAMGLAMDWLEINLTQNALIITDSKSVCDGLVHMNTDLAPLLLRLNNYQNELTIQWVPGHCGIAGNELADQAAKEAAEQDGRFSAISYKSICAKIKQVTKDPHLHTTAQRRYTLPSRNQKNG